MSEFEVGKTNDDGLEIRAHGPSYPPMGRFNNPVLYGSDLYWLGAWAKKIEKKLSSELHDPTETDSTIFNPDALAKQAMMKFSVDFDFIIKKIDDALKNSVNEREKHLENSQKNKDDALRVNLSYQYLADQILDGWQAIFDSLKERKPIDPTILPDVEEQAESTLSFDGTIVHLNNEKIDLTRLSNAAEWFSILWKQSDYLSFPEAKRTNPDLESANGKRLMDDVNKLIGKKVIRSSGAGYRIDSAFRRV